jgi:hypothetical protein
MAKWLVLSVWVIGLNVTGLKRLSYWSGWRCLELSDEPKALPWHLDGIVVGKLMLLSLWI